MQSDKPLATLVYDFSKGDPQLAAPGGNLRPAAVIREAVHERL